MLPCKLRLTGLNDSVVRPVFSAQVFIRISMVIFLFSRVFLSERLVLYGSNGGYLRISLSNDCCCTKCHLFVRISLRCGNVG